LEIEAKLEKLKTDIKSENSLVENTEKDIESAKKELEQKRTKLT